MHEGKMREVEQVVDHELPVRLDVQVGALGAPVRIVEPMEVGDLGRVGQRRIAHPDPDPVIAFGDRIGLHLGDARNVLLAGNARATGRRCQSAGRDNGIAAHRRSSLPMDSGR